MRERERERQRERERERERERSGYINYTRRILFEETDKETNGE